MNISLEKKDQIPLGGLDARLEKQEDEDFNTVPALWNANSFQGGIVLCFLPLPLTTLSG